MSEIPSLHGPKHISSTRQIALPKALMDETGLSPGDAVYLLEWKGRILLVQGETIGPRLEDLFRELAVPPA